MQPRRRFRFLKELSEGAFGKVYLAEMVTGEGFSSVVAIKLLHGKWTGHTEIVQRSRDEARVLGLLHHRNIIRVEDLTSINSQCAIVMEYLDGVDIKSLVNFCRDNESRIPRKVAFEIMAQTASALHAAYCSRPLQGGTPLEVIHRDIKPSNVMVTTAGDVKVLDFGTAQAQFDEREAHTQALAFGSAAYMAPERLLGDPDTPFGDVFSLGITLFEMLSLQGYGKINIRPEKFERRLSENLDKIDLSDLPEERRAQVLALMRLLLAYDPEDRPTAGQVVELLEALAEEIHDGSLRRFCREIVGPCRATLEPQQNPDDPLTGSTLFEDTGTMMRALEQSRDESQTWLEDEAEEEPSESVPPAVSAARSNPRSTAQDNEAPSFTLPASGLAASISGSGPRPQELGDEDLPSELVHAAAIKIMPSSGPAAEQVEDVVDDASGAVEGHGEVSSPEAYQSGPFQAPAAAISGARERQSAPVAAMGGVASVGRKAEPVARVAQGAVAEPSRSAPSESEESGGGGMIKLVVAAVLLLVIGGGGIAAVVAGGLLSSAGGGDDADSVTANSPDGSQGTAPIPKAPSGALSGGTHALDVGDATVVLTLSESGKGVVSLKGPQSKLEWDGTGELELTAAEAGMWRGKVATSGGSGRATFDVPAGQRCSFRYDVATMPDEWEALGCE